MFTNLLSLCLLLGVAKADYSSIEAKSIIPIDDLNDERHFYLDDQQCTATIPQGDLCNNQDPRGVMVQVWDVVAPPRIIINDDMTEVAVQRVPDNSGSCNGTANVDVKLDCDGPLPSQRSGVRSRLT